MLIIVIIIMGRFDENWYERRVGLGRLLQVGVPERRELGEEILENS